MDIIRSASLRGRDMEPRLLSTAVGRLDVDLCDGEFRFIVIVAVDGLLLLRLALGSTNWTAVVLP